MTRSLVLVVLLVAFAGTARAQWSGSPTIGTRVCPDSSVQRQNSIAEDGQGGAIVCWYDSSRFAGAVMAQRLNSAGQRLWGSGVTVDTNLNRLQTVAMLGDGHGGAFVAYAKDDLEFPQFPSTDAWLQHLGPGGSLLWGAGGIPVSTAHNGQNVFQLVSDGSGGLFMFWRDGRTDTSLSVYGQHVSAAGGMTWGTNGVMIPGAAFMSSFAAVSDGSGGAVIAWADDRFGMSNGNTLYTQRINGAGTSLWGGGVHVISSFVVRPTIVSDGTGGAIVAWQDLFRALRVQRVNAAGVRMWDTTGVRLSQAIRNQDLIVGTEDGQGGAYFAWSDAFASAGTVHAQRVTAGGVPQWTNNGVALSVGPRQQQAYAMIGDRRGGAIVAWHDYTSSVGNDYDLYAQRVDAAGNALWTANGLAFMTGPDNQQFPNLCIGVTGDVIASFDDSRSVTPGIQVHAQRITLAGTLSATADVAPPPPAGGALALLPVEPNPLHSSATIHCTLPQARHVRLQVFDLLGRAVATLADGPAMAGAHAWAFDASRLPSGVYLCTLRAGAESQSRRLVVLR